VLATTYDLSMVNAEDYRNLFEYPVHSDDYTNKVTLVVDTPKSKCLTNELESS